MDVNSWNQVIGRNIRRLREEKGWTQEYLAGFLFAFLAGKVPGKYTVWTVRDLEGRREREVRWHELAALCRLFDVPLWDLVLPVGTDLVDTKAALGQLHSPRPHDQYAELVSYTADPPDRDDIAVLLFNVTFDKLGAGELAQESRREYQREQDAVLRDLHYELKEVLDRFVGGDSGDD